MTDEPKLLAEPREGVPNVIDTLPAFRDYCSELASSHGSLAADAERASGFRYGHEDWLVQFKRDGAGIGLLDPQALPRPGRIGTISTVPSEMRYGFCMIPCRIFRDSPNSAWNRNGCSTRKSPRVCWD